MKKNLLILLVLFFGLIQNGLSQQENLNPKIKNESKLQLQDKNAPHRITDVIGATYCYGIIDDAASMEQINKIGLRSAFNFISLRSIKTV